MDAKLPLGSWKHYIGSYITPTLEREIYQDNVISVLGEKAPVRGVRENLSDIIQGLIFSFPVSATLGFGGAVAMSFFNVPEEIIKSYLIADFSLPVVTNVASGIYESIRTLRGNSDPAEI